MFVTLFANGALPLSVLLANSIVQDGHGALPLLAESRRAFLIVKAINLAAGFLVGAVALGVVRRTHQRSRLDVQEAHLAPRAPQPPWQDMRPE